MFLTGDFWRGHDWYRVSGWVTVTCAVGAALPHVSQKTGMMAEEKCFFSSIENSKQISWKWWCLQTLFGLFLKLWIKKNIFHHSLHSGLKFKFRFWHISAGVFHCVRPWGSYDQMCPFCHIFAPLLRKLGPSSFTEEVSPYINPPLQWQIIHLNLKLHLHF